MFQCDYDRQISPARWTYSGSPPEEGKTQREKPRRFPKAATVLNSVVTSRGQLYNDAFEKRTPAQNSCTKTMVDVKPSFNRKTTHIQWVIVCILV